MKKTALRQLIRENITSILKEDSYKSILLAKIKDCSLSEEEKAKMIADLEDGNKIPAVAAKLEAATKVTNENNKVTENKKLPGISFEYIKKLVIFDYNEGIDPDSDESNELDEASNIDELVNALDGLGFGGEEAYDFIFKAIIKPMGLNEAKGNAWLKALESDLARVKANPKEFSDPKKHNAAVKDIEKMINDFKSKSLKEETEDEDDASEFEKEPTAKDLKKGDSITINATKLGEISKELKATVGLWKKAEGKDKQKHLDKLKELTKLKKELEGAL